MPTFRFSGVRPKEVRVLLRQWANRGAELSMTGGNHVRVRFPNGKQITLPLTGSSHRAETLVRASARRYADWE